MRFRDDAKLDTSQVEDRRRRPSPPHVDGGRSYGRPTPEQRLFEIARRMSPGTVGGLVRSAAPIQRPAPVRVHRNDSSAQGPPDVIFNMVEAVALSPTNVGRFRFRRSVSTLYVVATLDVAGTSNTVVTLYRNGVALSPTVTLGSGATDSGATPVAITSTFDGVDDYLQAKVTTVGTGTPTELVVEVWGT